MAKDRPAQMRERHDTARAAGRTANGAAPYGYRLLDTGGLVEHEAEQEMVTEALRLRDVPNSWEQVARLLTLQGYRSRTGGVLSRQGLMQNVRSCRRWRARIAELAAEAQ